MTTGIILLNFGEPEAATVDRIQSYLERIFLDNSRLENCDPVEARDRAKRLATQRATEVAHEYEAIGGSPLRRQSLEQAAALEAELHDRGYTDVRTYVGMQYAEPLIAGAVDRAVSDDVDELVGLPVYPLAGPSTTVAALADFTEAVEEHSWVGPVHKLGGWHRHPLYLRLRADNVRSVLAEHDVDLSSDEAELVFAAHGTPKQYLEEGSRYEVYVQEWCETLARRLGIDSYTIGFQNHDSRGVEWTQPALKRAIESVRADRIVVEPVSFMHEQSETLWDLDVELREEARNLGVDVVRVPVPHDHEQFSSVLADLVDPLVGKVDPDVHQLGECRCVGGADTWCINRSRVN